MRLVLMYEDYYFISQAPRRRVLCDLQLPNEQSLNPRGILKTITFKFSLISYWMDVVTRKIDTFIKKHEMYVR